MSLFKSYMTILALHEAVNRGVGGRAGTSNSPVGLITIFVKFCPGYLISLRIEHGVVRRALRARG